MTQSLFFSPQVTSFSAQGTWAGEGRSVCGRREQQGVEGRGVLGLITCLGLKGKFTLFFAMCFIDRLSTGPRGCPHRHWCETGSLGGWKAAAKQNVADTSGSGSILKWQLGPILGKLLATDSSLLCGWDIMAGTAAIIQRAPVLYSSSAVGLFSGWLCIRYPLFQEPNAFYCQGEASLSYLMRSLSPHSCTAQSTSPCTSKGVWQIREFLTPASWNDDAEYPLVSPCPGKNQWHHFRWLHQSRLVLVPWSLTQVLIWDRAMALVIPRDHTDASWCLWRLRPRLHRVKALLVNFAALCSVVDLWEWMTNGDSHHMQVSFCCPQGWTGAKMLPCSSRFEKSNCWWQRIAASLLPPQQCRHLFLFYLERKGGTTVLPPSSLFSLQAAIPSPVKPQDIHSLLSGWTNQSKPLTGLSDIHLLPEICAPFISSPPSLLRVIWWCVYLFFRFSGWAPSLDNAIGWRNLSESPEIDFEGAENLQEIQCM